MSDSLIEGVHELARVDHGKQPSIINCTEANGSLPAWVEITVLLVCVSPYSVFLDAETTSSSSGFQPSEGLSLYDFRG